jgi:phosphoenolpyruvate phosphomutase / 2-hydroxyethylphosphonate cytidylyltransferase
MGDNNGHSSDVMKMTFLDRSGLDGKPLAFLPMCADIIHEGHINILKFAADKGKVVVLLMTDDAMRMYKREPSMPYEMREKILRSIVYVHDVLPCRGPNCYEPMALRYKPDYFVHGDDWKVGAQAASRMRVIKAMKGYVYHFLLLSREYQISITRVSLIRITHLYHERKSLERQRPNVY